MAINYIKIITVAFHSHTAALDPKMVLFENMSWNFKMRDLHLPLVNKYDVQTLHVSQLNTVVTINGHQLCKNYNFSISFTHCSIWPKIVLFENMSWNFKMRDLHLLLVNKYDVQTLHVSQLNTVVTINGHLLCKNYNCSISFTHCSTSSKNGTFWKYDLKL